MEQKQGFMCKKWAFHAGNSNALLRHVDFDKASNTVLSNPICKFTYVEKAFNGSIWGDEW